MKNIPTKSNNNENKWPGDCAAGRAVKLLWQSLGHHLTGELKMRPISDIFIGDMYKSYTGSEWVVLSIDKSEKMVEMTICDPLSTISYNPLWKKNTDKIFNNRVLCGKDFFAQINTSGFGVKK